MLAARQLACRRGERRVLDRIDLELRSGEVLGVLGANGAGKSTLLATLAGEIPAADGVVTLDGRALAQWTPSALARRRAVLPQSSALRFDLSVREVVAMGSYPFPELAPAEHDARLNHALVMAGAAAFGVRRYVSLSGGEQQRVQFARVLLQLLACRAAGEYRALLLDEPTASLDPRHQLALLSTVRRIVRAERLAAFVVLHDVNLAARWCDRLLLLASGATAALGPPREVVTPAILEAVYDTPVRVLPHPEGGGLPLVVFDHESAPSERRSPS